MESTIANIKNHFSFDSPRARHMEHTSGWVDNQHEQAIDQASIEHRIKFVDGQDEHLIDPQARMEHTSGWVADQEEEPRGPEFTFTVSPDDMYHARSRPVSRTRTKTRTGLPIPKPKEWQTDLNHRGSLIRNKEFAKLHPNKRKEIATGALDERRKRAYEAEVWEERMGRYERIQKRFDWAVHDPDAVDLTVDFIHALAGLATSADDDAVYKWWWKSGLSLDLTMDIEKLKDVILRTGTDHTLPEATVKPFTPPTLPMLRIPERYLPANRRHIETNIVESETEARIRSWKQIAKLNTSLECNGESWERSHVRGVSHFDMVNGPVMTGSEEGTTQGSITAGKRPSNSTRKRLVELDAACLCNDSKENSTIKDESMIGLEEESTQNSAPGHCPSKPVQPRSGDAHGTCLRNNSREQSPEEDDSEMEIDMTDIEMEKGSETSILPATSDIEMEDANQTTE